LSLLLHIETATKVCSACLSKEGQLIHIVEEYSEKYIHAERLTILIEQLMNDTNYNLKDLDAISIDKGPGSFTGLRIGVSTAKGLCYSLKIPLIAVDSLTSLYFGYKKIKGDISKNELVIPMIDARRMEVYTAAYNFLGEHHFQIDAKVIDQSFFDSLSQFNKLHILGDGSNKIKANFNAVNLEIHEKISCSAEYQIPQSFSKFRKKTFENVAYFEPYYLKDFKPN